MLLRKSTFFLGILSVTITISIPQPQDQEVQWTELYNTTDAEITAELYFLFTPSEGRCLCY